MLCGKEIKNYPAIFDRVIFFTEKYFQINYLAFFFLENATAPAAADITAARAAAAGAALSPVLGMDASFAAVVVSAFVSSAPETVSAAFVSVSAVFVKSTLEST